MPEVVLPIYGEVPEGPEGLVERSFTSPLAGEVGAEGAGWGRG